MNEIQQICIKKIKRQKQNPMEKNLRNSRGGKVNNNNNKKQKSSWRTKRLWYQIN